MTLGKSAYIPEMTLLSEHQSLSSLTLALLLVGLRARAWWEEFALQCATVLTHTRRWTCQPGLPSVSHKLIYVCSSSWEFCQRGPGEVILSPDEFPFTVFGGCSDEHDPRAFGNTSGPSLGTIGRVRGFISLCTKVPCLWKGKQRWHYPEKPELELRVWGVQVLVMKERLCLLLH